MNKKREDKLYIIIKADNNKGNSNTTTITVIYN